MKIATITMLGSALLLAAPAAANLIVNSDFELGNVGFTSDYIYSPSNIVPPATYDVVSDPSLSHPSATSYGDHTSGTGQMMAVNGSTSAGDLVWGQTLIVTPNATYDFAVWISSWFPQAPAQLEFLVNGTTIGSLVAPASTGTWDLAFATWNSGTATSASIEVRNGNTSFGGNDFALDGFFFGDPIFSNPDGDPQDVPAPAAVFLLSLGLATLAARQRRKSN